MSALSHLKFLTRRRWCYCLLLLQMCVASLNAAEKRLASDRVQPVLTRGKMASLGRVPVTNQMRLALSLPLRNASELTNLLAEIYNPGSAVFHHYLTPTEFAARFGPTPDDYAEVIRFAKTNGLTVTATHANRLVVDVRGQVSDVERALHVKINSYRHPKESRNFFAPDEEPTVDARLPIFHVSGLDNFSLPHPHVHWSPSATNNVNNISPHGGSGPDGNYMGNDFRQAYLPGTTLTGAGQNVGLLQFDGFQMDDITNYINTIGLTSNVPNIIVVPVNGGDPWPGGGQVEVALDIEMVLSISPCVSNIYVYEAPLDVNNWVDLLSQMANDNLAQQLSCSWGGGGPNPAAEQIFLQMAAQGQTFFNATGDSDSLIGTMEFPSESPNIIQVGGTYLTTDTNGDYESETTWNRGGGVGSSGGISPTVTIPAWQLGLDMTENHGSMFLRNVPDVALTAENVYLFCYGQGGPAAGTSCAAPLWAGLTALINQQAAQLGQPPVGFLNPAIYSQCKGTNYPALFHDITNGNNFNAHSPSNFPAATGYDLCTGWGSPAGTNLINALTSLDYLGVSPPTVFSSRGLVGGPFTQTNWNLTLTNSGAANLPWSLASVPAWLKISANFGTLASHGVTNLNLQLVNPEALPAGNYLAALLITNQSVSRVQSAGVLLNIAQSLVQNGGFETGDFTDWTFVGDLVVGNLVYNTVATDVEFPGLVHSGNFGAFLGEGGFAATLSQTLATMPGQRYLISCWLENSLADTGQLFSASWDGTSFIGLTNPPAFAWTNFLLVATATATNTELWFAAQNDSNFFGLDDVRVIPLPPLTFANFLAGDNTFQLAWNSLAGLNYQVQCTTNLAQGVWLNLCEMTAVASVTSFSDTNISVGAGQRFYRLVLP